MQRQTPQCFMGSGEAVKAVKGEEKTPQTSHTKCPRTAGGPGTLFQGPWWWQWEQAQRTLLTVPFPPLVLGRFLRCHHFLQGAPARAGLSRPIAEDGAVLTRGLAASNHSNKAGREFFLLPNLVSRLFHLHGSHCLGLQRPGWYHREAG